MPASVAKRGSLSASRSTISSAKAKIADWAVCSDMWILWNCAITREIEIYTVAGVALLATSRPDEVSVLDFSVVVKVDEPVLVDAQRAVGIVGAHVRISSSYDRVP